MPCRRCATLPKSAAARDAADDLCDADARRRRIDADDDAAMILMLS